MNADDTPAPSRPVALTRLCEVLASRLAAGGARHPVAAAVVLAARGHDGLDPVAFARRHQRSLDWVASAEAGQVAWELLPDTIGERLADMAGLDLLAIADLESFHRAHPDSDTTLASSEVMGQTHAAD